MKAIILGATGLVGSSLLEILLLDNRFDSVLIFTRKATGKTDLGLREEVIDFDKPGTWMPLVKGDILFSAFGTTLKKAGSKDAQYKIDYTYQYEFAKAAAENGVKTYVLVSAAYSSPDSKIFYSRIKGELERDVSKLPFENIHILRPGMLAGNRKEYRAGEKIWTPVMNVISLVPGLGYLKPIPDVQVARAMINAAIKPGKGIHIYPPKTLFKMAKA